MDSSAPFGFAGDQGYYNNLVGQMFTGGPSSWWQAVQNWWNLPADPSYSNGLQFFLGEQLVRPALGDNFIAGHSDWQVVGALYVASNAATLEWGCSLAVDMSNRLAESIGALLSRGGYIAYLTGDGNFSAAAEQSAAFGLGVLAESDTVNLAVMTTPLAPVYQALAAARAWVSGAEQPFGGKNPLQYYAGVLADEIDPEAAADGRKAAFAFDFAVQLAIDIAIEVATAGTATPALVAEEAAVEGASAARVAARGGKAVVEVIEQVPEARTAIQQTLRQGGKVAEEIVAAQGKAVQTGFKPLRNAGSELATRTGAARLGARNAGDLFDYSGLGRIDSDSQLFKQYAEALGERYGVRIEFTDEVSFGHTDEVAKVIRLNTQNATWSVLNHEVSHMRFIEAMGKWGTGQRLSNFELNLMEAIGYHETYLEGMAAGVSRRTLLVDTQIGAPFAQGANQALRSPSFGVRQSLDRAIEVWGRDFVGDALRFQGRGLHPNKPVLLP